MATTIGRIAKNALTWDVWAALAILVFTGVAKWHSSQMPVNAKVPTPVMPSPNARDYYNHAAAMERDSVQVDWACERPMDSSGVPKSITNDPTKGYHVFTLAEKDKWSPKTSRPLRSFGGVCALSTWLPRYAHSQEHSRNTRQTVGWRGCS